MGWDASLNGNLLGHFDVDQIPPPSERKGGLQGLEGVFLKWMIDENFGACHHRFLFIEYQPGVSIAPHDHTFEEAYFILSGEVEGTLDGKWYRAQAGDVLWTSVGCVHAFANISDQPVRWLETFSPQPPQENVFRFMADWEQRARYQSSVSWEGSETRRASMVTRSFLAYSSMRGPARAPSPPSSRSAHR